MDSERLRLLQSEPYRRYYIHSRKWTQLYQNSDSANITKATSLLSVHELDKSYAPHAMLAKKIPLTDDHLAHFRSKAHSTAAVVAAVPGYTESGLAVDLLADTAASAAGMVHCAEVFPSTSAELERPTVADAAEDIAVHIAAAAVSIHNLAVLGLGSAGTVEFVGMLPASDIEEFAGMCRASASVG